MEFLEAKGNAIKNPNVMNLLDDNIAIVYKFKKPLVSLNQVKAN